MEVNIRPVSYRAPSSVCILRRGRQETSEQVKPDTPRDVRPCPNLLSCLLLPQASTSDPFTFLRDMLHTSSFYQLPPEMQLYVQLPKCVSPVPNVPQSTVFDSPRAPPLRCPKGPSTFTCPNPGSYIIPRAQHVADAQCSLLSSNELRNSRNDPGVQQQSWLNKLWYIHSMEYYIAVKEKKKIAKNEWICMNYCGDIARVLKQRAVCRGVCTLCFLRGSDTGSLQGPCKYKSETNKRFLQAGQGRDKEQGLLSAPSVLLFDF